MDPTLKAKTTTAMIDGMLGFPPQMRVAAKYVLDHPSDFGLDSIRETARKAKVSTYTLVKMAKKLGFDSFEALRDPFRHALVSASNRATDPAWLGDLNAHETYGPVYANAAKNALAIVSNSLERQNIDDLESAADMLVSARTVYLTAVRSSYAVSYYFHYVGRMALPRMQLIPRHQNSAIDDLNDAAEGDVLVAITVTPYSRETMEACAFARKKGVKLLLITDSEVVSPELAPEKTIVTSVVSTHNFGCFSGMMAVIEVLLALLMARCGAAALERIKSYETLRIENNAYWVAQKKH